MLYVGVDWRLLSKMAGGGGGRNGARGELPELLVKGFDLLVFRTVDGTIGGLAGVNMLPGNVVPKYF